MDSREKFALAGEDGFSNFLGIGSKKKIKKAEAAAAAAQAQAADAQLQASKYQSDLQATLNAQKAAEAVSNTQQSLGLPSPTGAATEQATPATTTQAVAAATAPAAAAATDKSKYLFYGAIALGIIGAVIVYRKSV